MNVAECKKRLAIKLARDRDASLTTRALARAFHTSLRVVGDALSMDAADWRERIDSLAPAAPAARTPLPSSRGAITPGQPAPSTRSPRKYDPETDFDPDDFRNDA